LNNLGIIFNFSIFDQFVDQKKYLITMLSNNFEKISLINSENLAIGSKKKNYDISLLGSKVPYNFSILNPINSKELSDILNKGNFLLIKSIPMTFSYFLLFRILKKTNTKLILIHNIGVVGSNVKLSLIIKIKKFFFKKVPNIAIKLLTFINYFQKIDYRFMSNKSLYEKKMNKFDILVKKNVLINSMQYDEYTSQKYEVLEKEIVFLETNILGTDDYEIPKISEKQLKQIYEMSEAFLKSLSKLFNKKVTVCIHPSTNLEFMKKVYKDFNVTQYQTREKIYSSFITVFYETSAIIDALILKKNLIVLENRLMGETWLEYINVYPKKYGVFKYDLFLKKDIIKSELLDAMEKSKKNFDKFISNYNNVKPNTNGVEDIIKILKSNYVF
jgi:hypothetical protein